MSERSDRGAMHAIDGARQLRPGDFSFHGFGELRRDELRKLLRLSIRSNVLAVAVVEDAVFVPNSAASGNGTLKYTGGIVRPDGQPIDAAAMERKGGRRLGGVIAPISVEPTQELDEDVVYLGPLFNHYGRVLLESLARVWYLSRVEPSVRVVFTSANAAEAGLAPWVGDLLSLFGIPPERIVALDEPTRLRSAIVPEPLFEQLYSAHQEMIQPFRAVAARVAGDITPSAQPLYLSRSRLSSRQRPVIGELELESALRDSGFAVAYPETMTIADQIRLINSHTDIVSTLGSAAHTILFALHQPRLHLLTSRDDIPANFFLCSVLAEAPTTFVNALSAGGRVTPNEERINRRSESFENSEKKRPLDIDAGPQSMPQMVDFDRVAEYLNGRGMAGELSRVPAADTNSAIQRRFDEAWLYARIRKASTKSTLPPDIETESLQHAATSWPLSLMLARYYARARDAERTDAMANQFAELATAETDADRLAFYRGDVRGFIGRITRNCRPSTVDRLNNVLAATFPSDGEQGGASFTDD